MRQYVSVFIRVHAQCGPRGVTQSRGVSFFHSQLAQGQATLRTAIIKGSSAFVCRLCSVKYLTYVR